MIWWKRPFDLALSLSALLVLAPVIAVPDLRVRVKLGAPIFFRQQRPGLHGRAFFMVKFRTMTDARDASGALLPDAARLTSFGKFRRAASPDELLDTRHVLRCEASFPAPAILRYNRAAESRHSLTAYR